MAYLGTCLQTYIPIRSEPKSSAEMVSSLIFGETYSVYENKNDFLRIVTDFDKYEGWISADTFEEYIEFNEVNEYIFIEAKGEHQIMFIPCGAYLPESGEFTVGDSKFKLEKKLKSNQHLPLSLRIQKLAESFENIPYLWGGRSFMGIDCSGFMQVVFKANGIDLPRDSSQQCEVGKPINYNSKKVCDLVFFSKPNANKVSHVALYIGSDKVIHASGKVRIQTLHKDGIFEDGQLKYALKMIQRII